LSATDSTRAQPNRDHGEELLLDVLWAAWLYRLELTCLAVIGLAYAVLFRLTRDPATAGMVLAHTSGAPREDLRASVDRWTTVRVEVPGEANGITVTVQCRDGTWWVREAQQAAW
jgi:hypothetical protein